MFHWNVCSLESNLQYVIIGSDNGLAPNSRQAIIWIKDGFVYWHMYASLSLNEFRNYTCLGTKIFFFL